MPTHDWQFWVVSAVALAAAAWIIRSLARVIYPRKSRRGRSSRATLTVAGKPVQRSRGKAGPGA